VLPDLYRLVVLERPRGDNVLCRMARYSDHRVCKPGKRYNQSIESYRIASNQPTIKRTFVPDELLYNLARLQVPDVDGMVLGTAHDPLAIGDREGREAAVLFVDVTRVGLRLSPIRAGDTRCAVSD